jgi:hypothetical protein
MKAIHLIPLLAASLFISSCGDKAASPDDGPAADVQIRDPDGFYKPRSDASITKHPAPGTVIGKGQPVEFQYDGSKGQILSYQLYYMDSSGSVHPMGGGNIDAKGNGLHSQNIIVFNSSADKCPGFLELTTVSNVEKKADGTFTGKNISLGMYPIRFEVSE